MLFEIKKNLPVSYKAVIYATSYLNPLSELEQVAEELSCTIEKPCDVMFDLLLSNGDAFNRFVAGYFDGQQIAYDSLKVIEIKNNDAVKAINRYFHGKFAYLQNSVLDKKTQRKYGFPSLQEIIEK